VARHIFQACPVWIYTQSNITSIIVLQSLQILYTFVLRAEIATIFGPNVVGISARNTKVYFLPR
jgi:hypothetical protein